MIQHNHTDVFLDSFDSKKKIKRAIIVDSGCGDSYATKRLAADGARYINAYDPGIIGANHLEMHKSGCKISYTSRLEELAYDIVWSHHVVEHIQNPIAYLKHFGSYMKSDGELWLGCPNTADNPIFSYGHLSNFTISNLVLCLQCAGFDVKNIKWLINSGQIRIRIRRGACRTLPKPFDEMLEGQQHFNVNELPAVWRWNEE